MFNPTVGSSATSANSRHSRLPLQADLAAARGIVTAWRTTPSKPPSRSSRPGFASAFRGKADGQLPSIPIAAEGSRRVGPLRGFLPRAYSTPARTRRRALTRQQTRAGVEQPLTTEEVRVEFGQVADGRRSNIRVRAMNGRSSSSSSLIGHGLLRPRPVTGLRRANSDWHCLDLAGKCHSCFARLRDSHGGLSGKTAVRSRSDRAGVLELDRVRMML